MKIQLKNAYSLQYGEQGFFIAAGDIFVSGDSIVSMGYEPVNFDPEKVIDCTGKLVMPGLINAHSHNYMGLLRNIGNDQSLEKWLFESIFPREDMLTPEDCYWGATLSMMEMLRSGTTCFNDMYLKWDSSVKAAADAGMRAVFGRGLCDSTYEYGQESIEAAGAAIADWNSHERISFCLSPHAVYTCSGDYLRQVRDLSEKLDIPIHTHLSETTTEVENCKIAHNGLTPIRYYYEQGIFDRPVIAAHCVKATAEDIELLANANASVVTCPCSNLKLGSGLAPIDAFKAAGVNVAIGTDGPSSNNAQNMFREMNILSLVNKGVSEDCTVMRAEDMLYMATIGGAKALGMEDKIGRIAEGYKADLAILELRQPQLAPLNDVISSLVYSAYGSEVETVIIGGNIVMEERKFTQIDESQVYSEIEWRAAKLNQ